MKSVDETILGDVKASLERLLQAATNDSIRAKLRYLDEVCRDIVVIGGDRLTVPLVVKRYKARVADESLGLSEQTIRNKRRNGNPYQTLYRAWEDAAERIVAAARGRLPSANGGIIGEDEIRLIEDPTLRHQVILLFAQNRSLHNQVNMLKQEALDRPIQIDLLDVLPSPGSQPLSPGEIDAIRDFIDPRKLRAKHLERTNNDGVVTRGGQSIADPGFLTALEKVAKGYEIKD